jgi:hypothetical protein
MNAYRIKPKLGGTQTSEEKREPLGCGWSLLIIVILYIVLSAILRVTSNTGSQLDQIICYGALIVFLIVLILGIRGIYQNDKALEAERQKWQQSCMSAQLNIVNRHEGGVYDDGYKCHTFPCRLELEMDEAQRAVVPHQTTIIVEVSNYLFEQLKTRDSVRIYYKPETPLTFSLEDEL